MLAFLSVLFQLLEMSLFFMMIWCHGVIVSESLPECRYLLLRMAVAVRKCLISNLQIKYKTCSSEVEISHFQPNLLSHLRSWTMWTSWFWERQVSVCLQILPKDIYHLLKTLGVLPVAMFKLLFDHGMHLWSRNTKTVFIGFSFS